jgi:hypothetical protein
MQTSQDSTDAPQVILLSLEAGYHHPRTMRRGRKPFGYQANETVALERMIKLRRLGWGFDSIAMQLNNEGLPSRDGKLWHGLVVNRILTRLHAASAKPS